MLKVNGGGGSVPLANTGDAASSAPAPSPRRNALDTPVSTFEGASRSSAARAPVGPPPPQSTFTPADVDRVASMTDPVARNYAITQGYSDLSHQTAQLLGKDNANWATFGVWASRQAGTSIRGEDLPKFLVDGLNAVPGLAAAEAKVNSHLKAMGLPQLPSIPDIILKSSGAETQMSQALAGGNRIVFAEIGKEFAIFDQTFKGDTSYDQAKVDQYLQHFGPDQQGLKDGFAAYAKAMFEKDPTKKAQLMCLGNDAIGADEQARLQPYIEQALNAPDGVFRDAIQGAVNASVGHLPQPLKWLAQKELKHFGGVDKLVSAADDVFRHAATSMMMRLKTPNDDLHLGQDLPTPKGQAGSFPKDLTQITDPQLKQLLGQLDTSPNSLKGTGARDWSDYGQRMNYIIDLFRSRQQDPSLWDPPFPQTAAKGQALVA